MMENNPREFLLISDNDVFVSIIAFDGTSTSGLKYRVNFSLNTATWRSSFLSSTNADSQGSGSWVYSSSQNAIYSLTVFTVSNKVVMFTINASNGNALFSPVKFSASISETRGMILIEQKLFFILVSSSLSYCM